MFSIGALSTHTGVKIPTIRYYEERGLLPEAERSAGGQRRYDHASVERLSFIRHARQLGFSLEDVSELLHLQENPDTSCRVANSIAQAQLTEVRQKLAKLRALESELMRISEGCDGDGQSKDCYVLASLADHGLCAKEH